MNQRELTDRLDRASRLYYQGLQTEFTDTEFDLNFKELQKMEKESGVVYPNSPTLRVGSDIQDGFKKVAHPSPMLTIENVFDDEGLDEWVESMAKKYDEDVFQMSIKYDGVSCELHYVGGILKTAVTRGDKNVGDDITENVKTIKSVPLKLGEFFNPEDDFYVRGEILLPKSRLEEINKERIECGERPFANTRNACSGTIKLLNPKEVARRGLIFRAWDCLDSRFNTFATMDAKADFLVRCGFYYEEDTIPRLFTAYRLAEKTKASEKINIFKKKIDSLNLDYEYDGIVIKINSTKTQKDIGTKDTRAIEWGIARKWNEENIVTTVLNGIEWQVGRTGVLTPVGLLVPVECGGVVISNVTLHNYNFIKELDLKIGDTVVITRSGGVIPYVLRREERPDYFVGTEIEKPKKCPVCGTEVIDDGQLIRCVDTDCPAKSVGKIIQFCSKDCADIRSIGEKVAEELYESFVICSIEEIVRLGRKYAEMDDVEKRNFIRNSLSTLGPGYGVVSIRKIFEGIVTSRENTPFEKILAGLSIPGIGKVMARTLANIYKSAEGFRNCTYESLLDIEGIAETTATGIISWLHDSPDARVLDILGECGWKDRVEEAPETVGDAVLEGMKLCFTGKSSRFSGDDVETFLESQGAKCGHSVSKNIDYLITGDKPGAAKVKKAEEMGVKVIDELVFYEKYGL